MSRFYRRTEPGFKENLQAGLVAGGVAAVGAALSFYLTRLFVSREPLEPLSPETIKEGAGSAEERHGIAKGASANSGASSRAEPRKGRA